MNGLYRPLRRYVGPSRDVIMACKVSKSVVAFFYFEVRVLKGQKQLHISPSRVPSNIKVSDTSNRFVALCEDI